MAIETCVTWLSKCRSARIMTWAWRPICTT